MPTNTPLSIAMIGATGAVGGEALKALLPRTDIERLSLFGRRPVEGITQNFVQQHTVDVTDPSSYGNALAGHQAAICTLGVGQPSKVSREQFLKIDKEAVLHFAELCKAAGVQHFELLASVGISASSSSFYLRAKGELVEELKALSFARLSIFQPSMILTPENRYGFSQGVLLTIWPWLHPLLQGSFKKYRGVRVATLGQAIANNLFAAGEGPETLEWADFEALV